MGPIQGSGSLWVASGRSLGWRQEAGFHGLCGDPRTHGASRQLSHSILLWVGIIAIPRTLAEFGRPVWFITLKCAACLNREHSDHNFYPEILTT